ncbi:MAG TPA: type II toxin-antitoxin system HicA family toxin [Dehalococcoidia bacterium]
MPSLPRNVTQDQVVRALIRAGGVEVRGLGKGSHRSVRMPNQARPITVPSRIKTGLLGSIIKQAGLTLEQFLEVL